MKKLLIITLILVGCESQSQINPCDDVQSIKMNPSVLKDCFPDYSIFGIGEGTSTREDMAISKAVMVSNKDLLNNLKPPEITSKESRNESGWSSSSSSSIKIKTSGKVESIILKTFSYQENDLYQSMVITAGTLGKKSGFENENILASPTSSKPQNSKSSEASKFQFIPFDKPPKPRVHVRPLYPEIAQEAGIEGTIYVQFFIDIEGNVTEAYVTQGVPNTGLDEAAVEAVKKSKWYPAQQRDKKIGVWQTVPIVFSLTDE